jgi:hypothetical protein
MINLPLEYVHVNDTAFDHAGERISLFWSRMNSSGGGEGITVT